MTSDPTVATFLQALGDTPENVISAHLVRRGLGRAVWTGDPAHFQAAWVQSIHDPGEPCGYGEDAAALWALLQTLDGWKYPNVSLSVAEDLAHLMEHELGIPYRLYADVYHTLTRPAPIIPHPDVRRLTLDDLPLLETSEVASWCGFGGPAGLLREGFAAATLVNGQIVGLAQTYAITERHADVGIGILEPYRRRGYALAACSLVCQAVQAIGLTPVWSTGEDNHASLRLGQKLGFIETSHRVYLIPPKL
ncbi:MAG: GNAT family N-acetyltransferase [Anaerolineae bacterium]|nr:MAG: GNAT family N-acetyltransferase [Anaerolineae bacterium]